MRANLFKCKLIYPHLPPFHAKSSLTVRIRNWPIPEALIPTPPGQLWGICPPFQSRGGALANLARPRGRALGKHGENHGVCLMFGNFKSRTITGIIKNVSVGKHLRILHQATNLVVFWGRGICPLLSSPPPGI